MYYVARARHIDAQIDRLLARQISYARYCRTRAVAVRESAEGVQFSEIRATILRLALSYEQIADSVEQCIRRLADNAGKDVSSLLAAAEGKRNSHRSRRLSPLTSGTKAPLKKPDKEKRARVTAV
jgi:hypothetical protein